MFRITRTDSTGGGRPSAANASMSAIRKISRLTLIAFGCCFVLSSAAQDIVTLKSAVVTLAAQPELRAEFEEGLVAKAREREYNAVPSYDLVPDVTDVDNRDFIKKMLTNGIGAVLMVRPASVGP